MNKTRVSAVIIKKDQILLMHRHKLGQEYYCLPGGSVESGETAEQALIREIKEETNLDIKIDRLLKDFVYNYDNRRQIISLVTDFTGDLKIGEPEASRQSAKNQYQLEWVKVKDLDNLVFYPPEIVLDIQRQ